MLDRHVDAASHTLGEVAALCARVAELLRPYLGRVRRGA